MRCWRARLEEFARDELGASRNEIGWMPSEAAFATADVARDLKEWLCDSTPLPPDRLAAWVAVADRAGVADLAAWLVAHLSETRE